MQTIGQTDMDLDGLWKVLDTPPVYNLATIHTDLVSPGTIRTPSGKLF